MILQVGVDIHQEVLKIVGEMGIPAREAHLWRFGHFGRESVDLNKAPQNKNGWNPTKIGWFVRCFSFYFFSKLVFQVPLISFFGEGTFIPMIHFGWPSQRSNFTVSRRPWNDTSKGKHRFFSPNIFQRLRIYIGVFLEVAWKKHHLSPNIFQRLRI